MPQPPEVERLAEELTAAYAGAWDSVQTDLASIRDQPAQWRKRSRLLALDARIRDLMDGVDDQARAWFSERFPVIYSLGTAVTEQTLGIAFDWTSPHIDAVTHLANDAFTDLLAATSHVRATTRHLVRELTKTKVLDAVITGETPKVAAKELQRMLEQRGIWAVTYKDGSRHGLAEYADVVVRSKSAVGYNAGTLNHAVSLGTEWFELSDGFGCGLESHSSPPAANGMIVDAATAASFPISHPRCQRAVSPRPDITNAREAKQGRPSTTAAQRADQEASDKAREAASTRRAERRRTVAT